MIRCSDAQDEIFKKKEILKQIRKPSKWAEKVIEMKKKMVKTESLFDFQRAEVSLSLGNTQWIPDGYQIDTQRIPSGYLLCSLNSL